MSAALDALQEVRKPKGTLAPSTGADYEALLGTVGPVFVIRQRGEEFEDADKVEVGCASSFAKSSPPSIGAVWFDTRHLQTEREDYARCISFSEVPRMSPWVEVARKHERTYLVAFLFQFSERGERMRTWTEAPMAYCLKTGTARVLRVKTRPAHGYGWHWDYPMAVGNDGMPASEQADFLLFAMNEWSAQDLGWHVIAKRGRRQITVRIPEMETPRWFQSRVKVKVNGRSRPILHPVTAHRRKTKRGHTFVRPHLRGEREFEWGSMHVSIRVPALHAPMLSRFPRPADAEIAVKKGERLLTTAKALQIARDGYQRRAGERC